MANRKKIVQARDDWSPVETIPLTNGQGNAIKWLNLVSGHEATVRDGVHPMDNPNSILPSKINGAAGGQALILAAPPPSQSPDETEDDDEPIEETAADRVAAMFERVRGAERAIVKVKKYKEDKSLVLCDELSPEQFEQIGYLGVRKRFGAGKYRIELYASNPKTGRFSLYGVDETELMPLPREEQITGTSDPVLQKVLERLERIETTPRVDPFTQMTQMLGMMKLFREAMGTERQNDPMRNMRELIDMVSGIKTLREEIEPPAPPDTSLAGLGMEAMKMIGQAMAQRNGAAPDSLMPHVAVPPSLAMTATQAPTNPLQPNGHAAMTTEQNPQSNDELIAMNDAIAALNTMARFGTEAEFAASMIYQQAPDEVMELLQLPDWFERICQLAPTCKPFEAWYRKTHAEVLRILAEENEDTPPAKPAPKTQGGAGI